jgi:hypothetical protein
MRLRPQLLALAAVTLIAASARADDDALDKAREAFDRAQAAFEKGNFTEAAAQFDAAYQARPFAQFLFNIGACHEKLRDYAKAIEFYRKYLEAAPEATDRKKIEKRIAALEKAIEELKASPPASTTQPTTAEVPKSMQALPEAKPQGLVVIETDPEGAYIYLDSKKSKPLSKTPWNGQLSGEHTIYLEREGYKPAERKMSFNPEGFYTVVYGLSQEDYLGWINVTSTPPEAEVYIDDKRVGAYRKTPFEGNLEPGKHTIWITKEGYDEYVQTLQIVAGQPYKIHADLKGTPVGYLNVRGRDVEKVQILVDGKVLCERGPCRKAVPQGAHEVKVTRDGYKSYSLQLDMQPKTEVTLRADLAEEPSRTDAVVAYVFAGAFLGAGIFAGAKADTIKQDLQDDIDAGMPPPDSDDPRFLRGKLFSIGADTAYVLGGTSLALALYYTFRDKGAPSTGTTDVGALAIDPQVAPGYAGLGMAVRW